MNTDESRDHELHNKYSNIIKRVHKKLKIELKSGENVEKIWNNHLLDTSTLCEYSEAMHLLATEIWDKRPKENNRLLWIKKYINEYYFENGLKKIREKDQRRRNFHGLEKEENLEIEFPLKENLMLLDVGSCYNAFKDVLKFNTIAIDIQPANDSVWKCDFTNLKISQEEPSNVKLIKKPSNLSSLYPSSFYVVVFCLFLDYLPTTQQRFMSCLKAHHLLKKDGLLVVVKADSKKQHKNTQMAVEWRQAIESIGFSRTRYEKLQHLHCMAFRKTSNDALITFNSYSLKHPSLIMATAAHSDNNDSCCNDEALNEHKAEYILADYDFNDLNFLSSLPIVELLSVNQDFNTTPT